MLGRFVDEGDVVGTGSQFAVCAALVGLAIDDDIAVFGR
jgi:hypothetical protein